MLKLLTIGAIAVLLALRLLRGRFGARLLGVSAQVMTVVYLVALVITGVLAGLFEQWILLGVVVLLLVISGLEELRRRDRRRADVAPPRR
ncbi:hypothetical protein [Brachybacterium sacelli]|uniref:Uncharacterized protein n=1 Tax=Brachybacterium sacelli TaxID=173364 RepID=A0ABS4X5Z4_9MICO|nr:hypothetical protein [Brachybacterium sacelli]MBP2383663.1 hypothetical protein [Brachybacterium sacelli]